MRKSLIFTLMCTMCFYSFGQHKVYVENRSSEPITIAYGVVIDTKSYDGIQTEGWYHISPGEKKFITYVNYQEYGCYFFLHAHTKGNNKTWGDEVSLAVCDEAFKIRNANYKYVLDDNPNYYSVLFYKMYIPSRLTLMGLPTKEAVVVVTNGGIKWNVE